MARPLGNSPTLASGVPPIARGLARSHHTRERCHNQQRTREGIVMPRSKRKFDAVQERRLSEGIATGALPEAPPNQMWGGRGTEQPCEICGHPIAPSTVEFELD